MAVVPLTYHVRRSHDAGAVPALPSSSSIEHTRAPPPSGRTRLRESVCMRGAIAIAAFYFEIDLLLLYFDLSRMDLSTGGAVSAFWH